MAPWSEVEINRFLARQGMFNRRGLSPADSEQLAEKCLLRDRDMDDRRMCIECKNLQRGGGCFAAAQGWVAGAPRNLVPVKTILMRCERFEWAVPKASKETQ